MELIEFGIIGAGWRTEFFLRIAQLYPERFQVTGVLVRSEEKAKTIEQKWRVKACLTIDSLLKTGSPSFVVVSVPRAVAPEYTRQLAERDMPVLSETPPAPDLNGLIELYRLTEKGVKIQVAEQYQFQPLHAARIAFVNSGKLGTVSQVQISVCHEYHAISLARKFLGIGFENASISAGTFISQIVTGRNRQGPPLEEKLSSSKQVIASFDFGGKLFVYDFASEQYMSWIRSQRLLVRGERGEIVNDRVRFLKDFQTPVELDFKRQNAGENGNLEGYYMKGIIAGEEWIYQNPFIPARLSDDEIAVASCLEKMDAYSKGGPEFYGLAEAAQDHYLTIMLNKALQTKETVITETQPWAAAGK